MRVRIGIAAVLSVVACLAIASSASAYVGIGPKCILRVQTPFYVPSFGDIDGSGTTDCTGYPNNPPYFVENQGCIWVKEANGGYAQDNSSCDQSPTEGEIAFHVDEISSDPVHDSYAQGHTYETYTFGAEQDAYGGTLYDNTYESSPFTCGC